MEIKVHTLFVVKSVIIPLKIVVILRLCVILYLNYNDGGACMYRIAIEKLLKWKQSKRRKPLIIEGARQVGNNVKLEIM